MTQHLPAITVRPLPSSDYPAVLQMRVDAFSAEGVVPWPQEGQPHYIPADRRLGAYDQDRLVGHAGAWDFGQWLGGRRVPMAGIGSVIVVPEARGRGVGGALVNAVLSQAAEQGDVISCLYPTAPGVYRRFGYAFAGVRVERTVATAALREVPAPSVPPTLRPFDFDSDLDSVMRVLDTDSARGHGRVHRSATRHRLLCEPDEELRAWVAVRDDGVVGYLQIKRSQPDRDDHSSFRQKVIDLAADDRDTWLALWRLAGSQAPVCAVTEFISAPHGTTPARSTCCSNVARLNSRRPEGPPGWPRSTSARCPRCTPVTSPRAGWLAKGA